MKKIVFTGLICLSGIAGMAQIVEYDSDGKLIKLERKGTPNDTKVVADLNAAAQKQVRELLRKKIDQTLTALAKKDASANLFYHDVWSGDIGDIVTDLQYFKGLLSKTTAKEFNEEYDISKVKILRRTAGCIKHLYATQAYSIDRSTPYKIVLTQENLLNAFLVDLYNQTLPELKVDLSIQNYTDVSNAIIKEKNVADSVLTLFRKNRAVGNEYTLYCGIKDYQRKFDAFTQQNDGATILNTSWAKEWFWLRGGESKLNPLDFTTDAFVKNTPQFNAVNAQLFNRYIDSLLDRHLRNDSVQKLDEFNRLLSLKNSGKDVYSYKTRIDSLVARNEASRQALLTTSADINIVEIPKTDSFYAFSADPKIKFDNDEKQLKGPLHTDETKTILVYNVTQDIKVDLLETNKTIPDRSAFQDLTDTTFSYLGQIGKIVLSLSPYAGPLSNLSTLGQPNRAITVSGGSPAARGGTSNFTIRSFNSITNVSNDKSEILKSIKEQLEHNCAFNQLLFDISFTDVSSADRIENSLKAYHAGYSNTILKQLITDSLKAANYLSFYVNSTIPQTIPLEPQKATVARFATKILHTTTSDDPIKKEVSIYSIKSKDTVFLQKFSYKVGRNYRFQLSAGLAYTFGDYYSQSKAETVNGKIVVTNNVQQYHFVAGVHVYPFKGLYLQDNRFWGVPEERFSLYAGVGIPDPLGNIYVGPSYDLWPGLKITCGANIIKQNRYTIENDVITGSRLHYKTAGFFAALQIDPTSLLNMLSAFKQK